MSHSLHVYPTEVLLTIISKMDRTAFLRLYRSCKWLHNFIDENGKHIRNYVTNMKIEITIQKPSDYYSNGRYIRFDEDEEDFDKPLYYKLAIADDKSAVFQVFGTFCHEMSQFHGLRLTELNLYSMKFENIVELAEYLHSQRISCEKLTVLYRQYEPEDPEDCTRLTDLLKPLKLVFLPSKFYEDDEEDLRNELYGQLVRNVEHLSFAEGDSDRMQKIMGEYRKILMKTSLTIHYINDFSAHDADDDADTDGFLWIYRMLLGFYKKFMRSSDRKLKDFQFFCQDQRERAWDPRIGNLEDANQLLIYISGQKPPRKHRSYWPSGQSESIRVENPSDPNGPPVEAMFSTYSGVEPWEDPSGPHKLAYDKYHYLELEENPIKPILLKIWMPLVQGFHHNRLVLSIMEGRKDKKEYVMTLFADSSRRQRVYFAMAILVDWASYERFLGLMDTRNFVFPMEEIEEDVRKILCP